MDSSDYWNEIQSAWTKLQGEDALGNNFQIAEDVDEVTIWHFLISGLGDPYTGGEFLGILKFESEFPLAQPRLTLFTPNGRIETNTEIKCLSDEEWQTDPQPQRCLKKLIQFMFTQSFSEPFLLSSDYHSIVTLSEASRSSNLIHKSYLEYFNQIAMTPRDQGVLNNTPLAQPTTGLSSSRKSRIEFERIEKERAEMLSQIENHTNVTLQKLLSLDTVELPQFGFLPHTDEIRNELPVIKVNMSFKKWRYLQQAFWVGKPDTDDSRETARKLVVSLLDEMMIFAAQELKRRLVFAKLDFSQSDASMRAIFNGTLLGIPIHRETEVEHLNLSGTQTSANAMQNLFRLTNLQELYLDDCTSLIEAGRSVFSALAKKNPIPKLRLLSVVGTSSVLSHKWLSEIATTCPQLSEIYFTRKRGTKALGWQDIIMMQTMRRPTLLPCGHIGDKQSLTKLGCCSLDRIPFDVNAIVALEPALSYLCKSADDKWSVHIIDFLRSPLDAKTCYHSCGHFFNISSLKKLFTLPTECSNDILNTMKPYNCVACSKSLEDLRLCYPHSAEIDSAEQNFGGLPEIGAYTIEGLVKKKKK